jgi:hypothetical protein
MRRLVAFLAASLLTLALTGPAFAAPGRSGSHAVMYYLSLGDSFAASQQPAPGSWDNGYTEQLYVAAKATYPTLRHVKLGCAGGETTTTFIEGGVCDYSHGSQLDEAVSFLHAHRQFVAFVTIDIGWNDFTCIDEVSCVYGGLATIGTNLPRILDELREAAGPDVPIVGGTVYDPLLALWFSDPAKAQLSVDVIAGTATTPGVNDYVTGIYASKSMPVADVEGAFSTTRFSPLVWFPGLGKVPLNVAKICAYTWVCAPPPLGPDNHATTLGYFVMARAFAARLHL